eukprot:NODE_812_length_3996_cov_0.088016.p1 type:complete len:719 gc:universal NODE_812_length_3996_cov_0.088016:1121-3277(+)
MIANGLLEAHKQYFNREEKKLALTFLEGKTHSLVRTKHKQAKFQDTLGRLRTQSRDTINRYNSTSRHGTLSKQSSQSGMSSQSQLNSSSTQNTSENMSAIGSRNTTLTRPDRPESGLIEDENISFKESDEEKKLERTNSFTSVRSVKRISTMSLHRTPTVSSNTTIPSPNSSLNTISSASTAVPRPIPTTSSPLNPSANQMKSSNTPFVKPQNVPSNNQVSSTSNQATSQIMMNQMTPQMLTNQQVTNSKMNPQMMMMNQQMNPQMMMNQQMNPQMMMNQQMNPQMMMNQQMNPQMMMSNPMMMGPMNPMMMNPMMLVQSVFDPISRQMKFLFPGPDGQLMLVGMDQTSLKEESDEEYVNEEQEEEGEHLEFDNLFQALPEDVQKQFENPDEVAQVVDSNRIASSVAQESLKTANNSNTTDYKYNENQNRRELIPVLNPTDRKNIKSNLEQTLQFKMPSYIPPNEKKLNPGPIPASRNLQSIPPPPRNMPAPPSTPMIPEGLGKFSLRPTITNAQVNQLLQETQQQISQPQVPAFKLNNLSQQAQTKTQPPQDLPIPPSQLPPPIGVTKLSQSRQSPSNSISSGLLNQSQHGSSDSFSKKKQAPNPPDISSMETGSYDSFNRKKMALQSSASDSYTKMKTEQQIAESAAYFNKGKTNTPPNGSTDSLNRKKPAPPIPILPPLATGVKQANIGPSLSSEDFDKMLTDLNDFVQNPTGKK